MGVKEGRRIRSIKPIDAVSPFIMPTRTGASNIFSTSVDISKCEELIKHMRAEGMKGLGMIHIFMAAYTRVISQLPGLNRYIRGQRLYARKNMEICMTIKKELSLNAPETVIKIDATPCDTLATIYEKLVEEVSKNKQDGDQNSMDGVARVLMSFPSIFLKMTVWFLKMLDYFGLLPRALTKLSPFHGSMFITSMGSLGIPVIYHHLYDFGNIPVFMAFGRKMPRLSLTRDGKIVEKKYIDFSVVTDERICDGHYFATALKYLREVLKNPEILDNPPEKVIEDID